MYKFISSDNRNPEGMSLPSEAVSINGIYIEDLIDGYRTLYTRGREALSAEILSLENDRRDGQTYKGRRYPAREIVVGFQLLCDNAVDFRDKWNRLAGVLNEEEAQFIFADEEDKYFTGTVTDYSEPDPGQLNITSEFTIVCSDPLKYSVEPIIVEADEDDGATAVVDYKGTAPTRPELIAEFRRDGTVDQETGESDYVCFINERGKVLEIGDKEHFENLQDLVRSSDGTVTVYEEQILFRENAEKIANWDLNNAPGSGFTQEGQIYLGTLAELSQIVDRHEQPPKWIGKWDKLMDNEDQVIFAHPTSSPIGYGPGTGIHGPTLTKVIPADRNGMVGARDFEAQVVFKMHTRKHLANAREEAGHFWVVITDENDEILVAFKCWKYEGGTTGRASIQVGTKTSGYSFAPNIIKTFTDIDYYYDKDQFGVSGKAFDNNDDKMYWGDYFYSPKFYFYVTKYAGTFRFTFTRETPYSTKKYCSRLTYRSDLLTNSKACKMFVLFGQNDEDSPICNLGVESAKFYSESVATEYDSSTQWATVHKGLFRKYDIVIADCKDASVTLTTDYNFEGQSIEQYSKVANDWEDFTLMPGLNQFHLSCSNWTIEKPTLKIRYREAFL